MISYASYLSLSDLCYLVWASWWLRWQRICLQCGWPGFDLWVRKIPWRRKWQPTPVFLPGQSHGQRNLVGSSFLAWKIPWTEETGRLQSMGSQNVRGNWTQTHKYSLHCHYCEGFFFLTGGQLSRGRNKRSILYNHSPMFPVFLFCFLFISWVLCKSLFVKKEVF